MSVCTSLLSVCSSAVLTDHRGQHTYQGRSSKASQEECLASLRVVEHPLAVVAVVPEVWFFYFFLFFLFLVFFLKFFLFLPPSQYFILLLFVFFLSRRRLGHLQIVSIRVVARLPPRHDVQKHVGVVISVPQISPDRDERQLRTLPKG